MLLIYRGQTEQIYQGRCVCTVAGGPTYTLPIKGESSAVHYRFERRVIEFGQHPYHYSYYTLKLRLLLTTTKDTIQHTQKI